MKNWAVVNQNVYDDIGRKLEINYILSNNLADIVKNNFYLAIYAQIGKNINTIFSSPC